MTGDLPADLACAADDEDSAFLIERGRDRQDILADVFGLTHVAKDRRCQSHIRGGGGNQSEAAGGESRHDGGQHPLDQRRFHRSESEGGIADTIGRLPRVADVRLPHLDVGATRGDQAQRGIDLFAGQGTEDDVHRPFVGLRGKLAFELQ
ncbi:hypothetical protein NONI108955_44500 [Nocardia ninae]